MGERENTYKLGGRVEMDEAFFGGKKEGKRGRGSENKTEVAVALQLAGNGVPQFLKRSSQMQKVKPYQLLQKATY